MTSFTDLLPAATAAAVGVVLLTVALVGAPVRRRGGAAAWLASGHAFALGTLASVLLASSGHPLAAMATVGVALSGAAGIVALVRARPRGDDEDGGHGHGEDGPPASPDPGGPTVDWDEFERALWSHVEERDRAAT